MKSSLKKYNDNNYSKSTLYTTLRSESSFKKTNTFNLTERSSNKQTFITNEDTLENSKNFEKEKQTLENDKITCFDLMEILKEKRRNKLTIPLKQNKIMKEKLSNTVDDLKNQIEDISSKVSTIKNSQTKLNTSNKKNNSIKEVENTLRKEYLKEIETNRNICNEISEKIDELEHETFNSNNIYNELKNEVSVKQKKCKELSNEINQCIEEKKELNTLLIIYQRKIKNMKDKLYGKLMLEKRLKSGLNTIISNIDS